MDGLFPIGTHRALTTEAETIDFVVAPFRRETSLTQPIIPAKATWYFPNHTNESLKEIRGKIDSVQAVKLACKVDAHYFISIKHYINQLGELDDGF